jgi:hypothetical protein
MKRSGRISAPISRWFVMAVLLLGLPCMVAGCGNSALATGSSESPRRDFGPESMVSCKGAAASHSSYDPQDVAPKGQRILAGPIVVGCGRKLGELVRFIAYVQATHSGGEQLCYVLEQARQTSVTGGSCFQTAPSWDLCTEGCPLSVEATVAKWGKQPSKGTLITGATPGVIEEVDVSTSPVGGKKVTSPFIVTLEGAIQKELRLPSVVSLFASVVLPCLPAGQMVYASGDIAGEGFSMQGSDPFGCGA